MTDIDFAEAEAALDAEFADDIEAEILLGEQVGGDIIGKGPFHAFLMERFEIARKALRALITVDPSDYGRIAALQADIRFWEEATDWARQALDNARVAEDQIRDQDREDLAELSGEREDVED